MIVGNLSGESFLVALSGIVIVFIMLGLLAALVFAMSKLVLSFSKEAPIPTAAAAAAAPAPEITTPAIDPFETPMQIELTGVDDLTAACIIAIVSDEMGVSPDDLIFKSIKAL